MPRRGKEATTGENGVGSDAGQAGGPACAMIGRAPAALRRDRRGGQRQGKGGAGRRHLVPVLCIAPKRWQSETRSDRDQVAGLRCAPRIGGWPTTRWRRWLIAYGPVWAISTGRTATSKDAQAMPATVRIGRRRDGWAAAGNGVRIQYGGSVKPGNIARLMGRSRHRRRPLVSGGQPRPRRLRVDLLLPGLSTAEHG
ncbi:MAG: triose-phosphate isomerase [Candidatus Microthrix sp.]|nr:triose-phosphate isomerase [Candidatus Microthrix sp.]